ncbi:hypothetical protein [Stenotrophomonas maltophilia]|uniref:hypothetical protein n=1 Tax=Stenotrophomonas maltophilia TaxID=40324 RepID=UPI000F66840E|nr:hypothetical protein [Stenotrophomonas maltophilia]
MKALPNNLVAVDADEAITACVHGDVARVYFDAAYALDRAGSDTQALRAGGQEFVVRPAARLVSDAPTPESGRVRAHVMARRMLSDAVDRKITLLSSLPMREYFAVDGSVAEFAYRVEESLREHVMGEGERIVLPLDDAMVMPRTVAAYLDWAFDDDGNQRVIEQEHVFVVDVSGGFTSIALFETASAQRHEERGAELQSGWVNILRETCEQIASHHGLKDVPVQTGLRALIEERYRYRGTSWSCAQLLSVLCGPLALQICQHLVDANPPGAKRRPEVIVSGAGGAALARALAAAAGDSLSVRSLPRPEFGNARGMTKYGLALAREQS